MSAFLVSNEHINALISYALDQGVSISPANNPEQACRMLTEENIRSLRERYPGRDFLQEWEDEAKTYTFKKTKKLPHTQIVKACDCYDYQACETDRYYDSDAAEFIKRVMNEAVTRGGKAKGPIYNRMEWTL